MVVSVSWLSRSSESRKSVRRGWRNSVMYPNHWAKMRNATPSTIHFLACRPSYCCLSKVTRAQRRPSSFAAHRSRAKAPGPETTCQLPTPPWCKLCQDARIRGDRKEWANTARDEGKYVLRRARRQQLGIANIERAHCKRTYSNLLYSQHAMRHRGSH